PPPGAPIPSVDGDALSLRLARVEAAIHAIEDRQVLTARQCEDAIRRVDDLNARIESGFASEIAAALQGSPAANPDGDRRRQMADEAADVADSLARARAERDAITQSLDVLLGRAGGGVEQLHERIQRLISEADSARSALAESIPEGHMLSALRQLV